MLFGFRLDYFQPRHNELCAQAGERAGKTAGQRYESVMMRSKQFKVNARLGIKAGSPAFGNHGNQILISGIVLAKQNQMIALAVDSVCLVTP